MKLRNKAAMAVPLQLLVRLGGGCRKHQKNMATHAADAGANLRDIQEILGHKSLETTMIYVHPEPDRVISPLSRLNIRVA